MSTKDADDKELERRIAVELGALSERLVAAGPREITRHPLGIIEQDHELQPDGTTISSEMKEVVGLTIEEKGYNRSNKQWRKAIKEVLGYED